MTRSSANTSARFRQRKLSTRQTLQILREDQIEQEDDITQRNVPKVETGVEKGEEIVSLLSFLFSFWVTPCDRRTLCRVPNINMHVGTPPPSRLISLSSSCCWR